LVLLDFDDESKVATVTLNAPETYNALTVEMGVQFQSLIRKMQVDLDSGELNANAVVLTGAADKAFSAGGNFDWLRSLAHNPVHVNQDIMVRFYKSFLCIRDLPIPVVAAIHGPAIGAGACLATACDLRVGSATRTQLGFTFSSLGIHAGMGGSYLLPQAIGPSAATEALLTAKVFTGTEAYQVGLLNRLISTSSDTTDNQSNSVKEAAHALASQIAQQHPLATRSMTRSIRLQHDSNLEMALHREAHAQAMCYARSDWGKGLDALVAREPPIFDDYHNA
jgi:enoyl-CoA hydratase/carnithine racemase